MPGAGHMKLSKTASLLLGALSKAAKVRVMEPMAGAQ